MKDKARSETPRGFPRWKRNRSGCCAQEGGDAVEPEERAPLFFRVRRQTQPVSQSVSQPVEHWLHPSPAGVPAQRERVWKLSPLFVISPPPPLSLDCYILWEEKGEERKGETAWEWRSTKVRNSPRLSLFSNNETELTSLMQASESQADINSLAFTCLERSVFHGNLLLVAWPWLHLGSTVGYLLVLMIKNSSEADCWDMKANVPQMSSFSAEHLKILYTLGHC